MTSGRIGVDLRIRYTPSAIMQVNLAAATLSGRCFVRWGRSAVSASEATLWTHALSLRKKRVAAALHENEPAKMIPLCILQWFLVDPCSRHTNSVVCDRSSWHGISWVPTDKKTNNGARSAPKNWRHGLVGGRDLMWRPFQDGGVKRQPGYVALFPSQRKPGCKRYRFTRLAPVKQLAPYPSERNSRTHENRQQKLRH